MSAFNSNAFTQDLLAKSFAGAMVRLMPNGTAPLFGLSALLPKATAKQVEHGYFSKTMVFPEVVLNAAVADGVATTFTVVSTAKVVPGQLLRAHTTGEIVRILTVPNATSITVARGVGNVAAAAIADTTPLYGVGNAFEEGSARPQSQLIMPTRVTNFTQIFRNSWAISDTVRASMSIAGEGNLSESRMDCMAFHGADIEKALFFGQRSTGTVNGNYFHTMDGLESVIRQYAASNINTAGGTTTFDQLETLLDPVFNQVTDPKSGNERVLFVGGAARRVITGIGRKSGQYQIVDGQTSFGLQFSTFKISRGTFRIIEHPLFNSNVNWSRMAVAVDLSSFSLAYLDGRDTKNIEYGLDGKAADNGIDAVGGTLTTELTTEIKNPQANAIIYGLTAAA